MPETIEDREGNEVSVDDVVVLHPESKMWGAGDRRARVCQINRSRVFVRSFNSGRRYELRRTDFTREG